MGQQDSRPHLSRNLSPRNITYKLPQAPNKSKPAAARIQCEGVLKLQATPFKNCIEIETETEVLFLEAVELTLKQLLEGRLHTNKLFLGEDIDRLVEGVTFALAHLQQKGVTYKDIDPQNIFYDNGNFKLLPNELICLNSYQKLRQGAPVLPSPELIIALRCGEEEVTEEDILQKSNVFTFGMLLLEVCTLLPSEQCYDSQNYDILDAVINERVLLVEQYYGERIAKIVANMLDYDYTERMNLKDLSIWVNRQLQASKATSSSSEHQHPLSLPNQEPMAHSVLASKVERSQGKAEKSKSRLAKNNSVYMNLPKEEGREERNKIYINDTARQDEPPPRSFARQPSREALQPNRPYRNEQTEKPNIDRFLCNQSLNDSDSYKFNDSLPLRDTRFPPEQQRPSHPYQLNQDYKMSQAPTKKENAYQRSLMDRDTVTKRIAKEPARPFRNQEDSQKGPLREVGNQYYPNIEQILKSKPQMPKGEARNDLIKGPMGENGSLTRIKQEIMKSKKLIEQFKRTQGKA